MKITALKKIHFFYRIGRLSFLSRSFPLFFDHKCFSRTHIIRNRAKSEEISDLYFLGTYDTITAQKHFTPN